MKKITIAGASGFVGRFLSATLLEKGYDVIGIGTSAEHFFEKEYEHFSWVRADTTKTGPWQDYIRDSDIVVNLIGRNIFSYWTKKYKQAIYDSRILTTRHIVQAMGEKTNQLLINASAAGIYGDRGETLLNEETPVGNGFLADVCVDWEKEARKVEKKGVDIAIMRLGVVLGDGGALEKMVPAFKMFLGGPLGDGQQWFPWIHIRDLGRAVIQMISNEIVPGIYNFTGIEPVRHAEFAKTLAKELGRPCLMPAPAFMIRLVMGELGKALLQSQKTIPKALLDSGFKFEFADLSSALSDIVTK